MPLNTSINNPHPSPATITARSPLLPSWNTGSHPANLPSPIYSFLSDDSNFSKTTSGQDCSLPFPLPLFFKNFSVIRIELLKWLKRSFLIWPEFLSSLISCACHFISSIPHAFILQSHAHSVPATRSTPPFLTTYTRKHLFTLQIS